MTGDEARELFSAAYENQLGADERASFDRLLEQDTALREEYETFRRELGRLRGALWQERPLAPDLLQSVQRELHERSGGKFYRDRFSRNRYAFTKLLWGAIVLLLLIVAAIYLVSWGGGVHLDAKGP